ncbi:MAG TPA: hypothetical protein VM264_03235, partial [Acidimicrobiales bacterium]|nr:hypothetical protein [Acidimicrobiales bacterium]
MARADALAPETQADDSGGSRAPGDGHVVCAAGTYGPPAVQAGYFLTARDDGAFASGGAVFRAPR